MQGGVGVLRRRVAHLDTLEHEHARITGERMRRAHVPSTKQVWADPLSDTQRGHPAWLPHLDIRAFDTASFMISPFDESQCLSRHRNWR
jgi:hypothetical protein